MKRTPCDFSTNAPTTTVTPPMASARPSQTPQSAGAAQGKSLAGALTLEMKAMPRTRKTAAQSMALLAAGAVLLAGCASQKPKLVLDPVGPEPAPAPISSSPGSLLVYSAFDPAADFSRSPYRRRHTDYRILDQEGQRLLQEVQNDREVTLDGPRKVLLPPGRYTVQARANGYGVVTVPVVIESGKTTTVHLEGSVWWPRSSSIFQSDPVRLPGGEIAGWRAAASSTSGH